MMAQWPDLLLDATAMHVELHECALASNLGLLTMHNGLNSQCIYTGLPFFQDLGQLMYIIPV